VTQAYPRQERRVFSARLEEFLESLREGTTPNYGRFCSFCYNPTPEGYERCDHCGQDLKERPPSISIPEEVLAMFRRKLRRESIIVNSFAYFGLLMGVSLFIGVVAMAFFYFDLALWLLIFSMFVLLVGSRVLAGIFGGIIGDEIGYRYANRRLAEDWAEFVATRQNGRINGSQR
jgi:hypothetical protein